MSYTSEVMADVPLLYWKLDEATGNFADSSGSGKTAIPKSPKPAYRQARAIDAGYSILSSAGCAAEVCDSLAFTDATIFTLEAWIKTTATTNVHGVIELGANSKQLSVDGATGKLLLSRSPGVLDATSTIPVNDGRWHHVVAKASGTATTQLFIDGVNRTGATSNEIFTNNSNCFGFGAMWSASAATPIANSSFIGNLDEIAVYDSALSDGRILAHYQAGVPPSALTADFERGVHGNNVTTASGEASATAWNAINTPGGTVKYDNTHSYGGLATKIVASGASTAAMDWTTALGTATDHYGRIYLWLDSYPTGDSLRFVGTNPSYVLLTLSTGGLVGINLYNGGGVGFTTPVALGQWVRLEWHMIHSVTAGQVEAKLFNVANSAAPTEVVATSASADTGANITGMSFGFGSGSSATATFWMDNIVAGASTYPGPAVLDTQVPSQSHVFGHNVW